MLDEVAVIKHNISFKYKRFAKVFKYKRKKDNRQIATKEILTRY